MTATKYRQIYIITGASRGLGLAMARRVLAAGHSVVTIARNQNPELAHQAPGAAARLQQWQADLVDAQPVAQELRQWLRVLAPRPSRAVTLINNAGIVPTVQPLGDTNAADIARTLRINLEAAMVLSAAFLAGTQDWACQRRILNISSGLGRYPMAAQGPYCASKAGMDLYTRCLALEEAQRPNGARVCALAPGVVDTDMQVHLRSADPARFPDRSRFVRLHDEGILVSADATAQRILAYLERPEFGQEPVADIREIPA